ncbi:Electron-transferring-flavoprotein dehydrogenase [Candidatus Sulfotelmatomonas gaucii]|uniref:Electron transfer flavoprotein-ubiquinone oxidoreductase n=1 Tax=Candidatus Sulfuritelmatomonas gaucii TaxID=2043161 RepID=A0A2N9L7D3_9BACT|nr:Electron-transferring-flavoprotein dehydrogenase [Candidatus Sulfotelmatomonas gaucii]
MGAPGPGSPRTGLGPGGGGPDFGTWETTQPSPQTVDLDRPSMDVDIVCAGFGPATGGFLTTLTQAWTQNPADPAFESKVAPGTPLQVLCYERADDLAAGVSGVVSRANNIRASFPAFDPAAIPMAAEVKQERVLYLLDPIGASRRSFPLRLADSVLKLFRTFCIRDAAFELPFTPAFLHKHGGLILSIGQFNQWVGSQLMASGFVQIWPGMPVAAPIFAESSDTATRAVAGLRLADQGVDKLGAPADSYMPGMDVHARLTVVGDGPVGAVGQKLDERFGLPAGHARREWALGMKFVIELPEDSKLEPGTVWHTFGFPEPEIFGFLYVHPDRLASVGIFIPSWLGDPARTAYRYLQHYIQHPALWRHLAGGTLRSWGAKSLEESGKHGEPFLTGDGYARIGEGSGSTNMLTGSGVDEAWSTGVQLGHSVLELLRAGQPFTQQNLAATYEKRRRSSSVERGAQEAANARNGFHRGVLRGLIGMALAGLTRGRLSLPAHIPPASSQIRRFATHGQSRLKLRQAAELATADGRPLHDALLSMRGWPEIPFDGQLLVTHQDALLLGGKVQAMPGFADHVVFLDKRRCIACEEKTCIAMCAGQAITLDSDGTPAFEREKCVHCGACLWNCAHSPDGERSNIDFRAGSGGLHSGEN